MSVRFHRQGTVLNAAYRKLAFVVLLLLAAGLLACTPTSPTPTLSPFQGRSVLLRDDFSTSNAAWTLFDTTEGAAYIRDGELTLEDRGQGIGIYAQQLNQSWDDVVINVQVRQVAGTQNNWMGVLARQQDEQNYYLFAFSADGYYLILRVKDGVSTALAGPTSDEYINPGQDTNYLQVRCEGNTLALSVNGLLRASRTDDTFAAGQVALFADAVAPGETTTVAFDSLVLSEP